MIAISDLNALRVNAVGALKAKRSYSVYINVRAKYTPKSSQTVHELRFKPLFAVVSNSKALSTPTTGAGIMFLSIWVTKNTYGLIMPQTNSFGVIHI